MLKTLFFIGALQLRKSSDPLDAELANLVAAGLLLSTIAAVSRNDASASELFFI